MQMKDMMTTGVPLLHPGDSLRRAVELFRVILLEDMTWGRRLTRFTCAR